MGDLGKLTQLGFAPTAMYQNPVSATGWVVKFDPTDIGIRIRCEVYHMAVQGPPNSTFQVYKGTTFYDNVVRGDINSWDPAQPMPVSPDDTVFFYYDSAAAPAPTATLFFREPSPV